MEGIDADGRPQLVVQIDVIGQPEPLAGVAEAVFIDLRLQGSQLTDIGNLIGSSFRAAARPYRRPHGIERQRFIFLYAYGGRGNAAVVFQLERNLTAGRLAPAEECAVLVLEAQLRIGLNGEASVGIAFDPLLLRYSRSFAAVGVIDKGDHALHAGFKAAVPARDMHGVIGCLLLVNPLQCTGNIFAGSIQHIHQLNIADFIGLFPIDFGYCDTLRLVGVSDTSTVLDVDTGFPGNISIVAVDHRAAADVVGLPRCAGHRAEVIAVGHVAIARNAARHIFIFFILTGCTSDTPVVIAVCCSSGSDNTAGIYFLSRSRSGYTAGIPAEIRCTADHLSGYATNVTILLNVIYGYRSFI